MVTEIKSKSTYVYQELKHNTTTKYSSNCSCSDSIYERE